MATLPHVIHAYGLISAIATVTDALGRTIAVTSPTGSVSTRYDGLGNRLQTTNAVDEVVTFRYDDFNRLIEQARCLDGAACQQPLRQQFRYNLAGERIAAVDAEGVGSCYAYDGLGRLEKVGQDCQLTGSLQFSNNTFVTTYRYDAVGNRIATLDANGHQTTYAYDALNRRVALTDPLSQTTRYGYNVLNQRTVMTDANGTVTRFAFDDGNRLTEIDYGDSTADVRFTYDDLNRRQTMQDGTGRTSYSYDELNRLTEVTNGANQTVGYRYDAVGNRTQLIYPNNQTVNYHYDSGYRLDTVTDWANQRYDYTFDAANRLTQLNLPNGITSSYTYDTAGRLTDISHALASVEVAHYQYQFNPVDQPIRATEMVATQLDIPAGTYLEAEGQVTLEAEHHTAALTGTGTAWLTRTGLAGYQGDGYLQALPDIDRLFQPAVISDSPGLNYPIYFNQPGQYHVWVRGQAPNAAGDSLYVSLSGELVEESSLETVTGLEAVPDRWSWANRQQTADGSLQAARLPIAAHGLYTLTVQAREDGVRLDRLFLTNGEDVPTESGPAESYRYPTVMPKAVLTHSRVISYQYDSLRRLTEADYSTGERFAYTYDAVGNRLQLTEQTPLSGTRVTTYSYNVANQLQTARTDEEVMWHYLYDANGNQLRQVPGGTDPAEGETRYSYDAANQLVKVELYTGGSYVTLSEARYDGEGKRVSLTTYALGAAQTVNYLYGEAGRVLLAEQSGQTTTYLYGATQLLGEYTAAQGWQYTLRDLQQSGRQTVDGTGQVTSARDYKPFGGLLTSRGAYASRYGFLGSQVDRLSGLLYTGGRYYDPVTGRFLTAAHEGGSNPYSPFSLMLLLPGMGLLLWRGRRDGPWRVVVLVCVIGMSGLLVSCGNTSQPTRPPGPIGGVPTLPPNVEYVTGTPRPTATQKRPPGISSREPTRDPFNVPLTPVGVTPVSTNSSVQSTPIAPTPYPSEECPAGDQIEWLPGLFAITYYSIALEWDPVFAGSEQVQAKTLPIGSYLEGRYPSKFLYGNSEAVPGILWQGTGRTSGGKYIIPEWWQTGGPKGEDTTFVGGVGADVTEWRTVAVDPSVVGEKGTKIVIESVKNGKASAVTDSKGVFTVTDTGRLVQGNKIDVFVGEKLISEIRTMSSQTPEISNTRVGVIKQ